MLKARKRNRIVRIPDEKVGEYKKMGYTITDLDGKTIFEPQDDKATIASLRKEIAVLKQKIAEYELLMVQKGKTAEPEAKAEEKTEAKADAKAEKATETPKRAKTTKTKAE